LKQSLAGGQSTEPVSATRLAPVSRQGFAPKILAEQFIHFIRELLCSILRLKQSLAGRQSTEPVSATRLAPVSRQGFAPKILAEQFIHFIRELLYSALKKAVAAAPHTGHFPSRGPSWV
jgi:hypothetical protein